MSSFREMFDTKYAWQSFREWFPSALPEDFANAEHGIYANKKDLEFYEPLDCIVKDDDDAYKTQCVARVRIPAKSLITKPDEAGIIRPHDAIVDSVTPVLEKHKGSNVIDAWTPTKPYWTDFEIDTYFGRWVAGEKRIEEMHMDHSNATRPTDLRMITSEKDAIESFPEIQEIPVRYPFEKRGNGDIQALVYVGDKRAIATADERAIAEADKSDE